MAIQATYLTYLKGILRYGPSVTSFDEEITDLAEAAQDDIVLAGVLQSMMDVFIADPDADKLLKRAVTTYVKANFGWDNPNLVEFGESYDLQKMRLTLTRKYTEE